MLTFCEHQENFHTDFIGCRTNVVRNSIGSGRRHRDNFPHGRKLEKAILAIAKTRGSHSGFEWDDEREEWVPRDDKELTGRPNKGTQSGDKGDKPVELTEVEKHGLFGWEE